MLQVFTFVWHFYEDKPPQVESTNIVLVPAYGSNVFGRVMVHIKKGHPGSQIAVVGLSHHMSPEEEGILTEKGVFFGDVQDDECYMEEVQDDVERIMAIFFQEFLEAKVVPRTHLPRPVDRQPLGPSQPIVN